MTFGADPAIGRAQSVQVGRPSRNCSGALIVTIVGFASPACAARKIALAQR
jgi:hypothetical protein